jgi:hypothetical protein
MIYNTSTNQYNFYNGTAWTAIGAGGGAPVGASYVVAVSESGLTAERILTAGTGISVTDVAGNPGSITVANTGDLSSTNEIQNVITGMGLYRDASNNFGLYNTCGANQILKWNGSSWNCADDLTGGGAGGYWTLSGNSLYPSSTAYNVLIGTTSSQSGAPKLYSYSAPSSSTVDFKNMWVNATGSFDTSSTELGNYGMYFESHAKRSAGSNELNNYGVVGYAYGSAGVKNIGVAGMAQMGEISNIGLYGYASGTDAWALYVYGKSYFSDNVGIGTKDPAERLDLGGGNIKMGYEIITNQCKGASINTCNAVCSAGKQVLGGGCVTNVWSSTTIASSYPINTTTWQCQILGSVTDPNYLNAYAICANIK